MIKTLLKILSIFIAISLVYVFVLQRENTNYTSESANYNNNDTPSTDKALSQQEEANKTEKDMTINNEDSTKRPRSDPEKSESEEKPTSELFDTSPTNTYKYVTTTVFWVGEEASVYNGYIDNKSSAWDLDWVKSFGGFDDPYDRCGYLPCKFKPKENPFYFALPYMGIDENGPKESLKKIPWYTKDSKPTQLIKNRWIEVVHDGNTCYAQWEDVGPYETDDFDYVFGNSSPLNTVDFVRSGLDVSPAMRDCLSLNENGITTTGWRFVEFSEVPPGPWLDTITSTY